MVSALPLNEMSGTSRVEHNVHPTWHAFTISLDSTRHNEDSQTDHNDTVVTHTANLSSFF